MKITYLIQKVQANGTSCLCVATAGEWRDAVRANRGLPAEQRRYFIFDYIEDGKELDCMVIEAPEKEYRAWNREHMASERNRVLKKNFQHLSLDMVLFGTDEARTFHDTITAPVQVEESVLQEILMETLRSELAAWKPWANDLLGLYEDGQERASTALLAAKCGVSKQTARKYKRQFENFIKNFFIGVSL